MSYSKCSVTVFRSCTPHCLNFSIFPGQRSLLPVWGGELHPPGPCPAVCLCQLHHQGVGRESCQWILQQAHCEGCVESVHVCSLYMYTSTVCVCLMCGSAHSLSRMPSEDPVGQVSEWVCWPGKVGTGQPTRCTRTA